MRPNRAAYPLLLFAVCALAQDSTTTVPHVSLAYPVQTAAHTLSADREMVAPNPAARPRPRIANPPANSWKLLATLPGAIVHDMVFVNVLIGYAVAEAGQVWKTTDGGKTWSEVLNLGYPYYFYGVAALNWKTLVVSGFIDSPTEQAGVLRWTQDGGKTWGGDVTFPSTSLQRVRFANSLDGLMFDTSNGTAQYTTDGGSTFSDWTTVDANSFQGWFGQQFSYLPTLHTRASGTNFCSSPNGQQEWVCGPSVDKVFDAPVFFRSDSLGWVGGGQIYPTVEGWVHLTTNGGKNWSGRTLDGPWPIRGLLFVTPKDGWAAGGNYYTGVGGIYFTGDGGNTWSVDVTTNAEMDACDQKPLKTGHQIWCIGYDRSNTSYVYSTVTSQ